MMITGPETSRADDYTVAWAINTVYCRSGILLEQSDDIEIFNKKAIYLYLREISGLNTKQVVNSLKKFRKRYGSFRDDWDSGEK